MRKFRNILFLTMATSILTSCGKSTTEKQSESMAEQKVTEKISSEINSTVVTNEEFKGQTFEVELDSIAATMEAKEEYQDYYASMDEHRSVYAQLQIMAENKELWLDELDYADEIYQYAVTDLDCNGRYEIIVSQMGGTGLYTYSRFFQVNNSYDGLEECETNFREGDSQPDLMEDEWTAYMDVNGIFYYVVKDLLKLGAAEYYENVQVLSLQNSKISLQPVVYRSTIYQEGVPVVHCEDAEGNAVSEEKYEYAVQEYFAGCQENTIRLGWQRCKELSEDTEEIIAQLQASYEVQE